MVGRGRGWHGHGRGFGGRGGWQQADLPPADDAAGWVPGPPPGGLVTGRARRTRGRGAIAQEGEHRYGRKVAWGAVAGDTRQLFTTLSAPVMTRLRQPERQVLDTLVDAGVARSRSEALAWCVRLVGEHAD